MCSDCNAARITTGHWPYHDPACIYCGARLIQRLGRIRQLPSIITQRRQVVLRDWMAMGHSEQEIRELVKGLMAVAPVQKAVRNG